MEIGRKGCPDISMSGWAVSKSRVSEKRGIYE